VGIVTHEMTSNVAMAGANAIWHKTSMQLLRGCVYRQLTKQFISIFML
jgi:hypothetical protein